MIKFFNILNQTLLCLLLMGHLLAISVCDDYLSKLINKPSIERVIKIEKNTNKDSKDKNVEFDDSEDEYFENLLNKFIHINSFLKQKSLSKVSFQYLQIALPQSINEILIPPPRL